MVDERENIRPPEKSLASGGKPAAKVVASIPPQKDVPIGLGIVTPEMERYRAMIAKDPTSRVFAALAELYRKAGMLDEAVRLCLNGTKAHPKYMSGRVALARAYFDKGMIKEAKEEILTVVTITPDNIVAHKILGDIHLLEGDAANARESFVKVLSLSPDDAEAKQKLSQVDRTPAKAAEEPQKEEEILDGEALEVVTEEEAAAMPEEAVPSAEDEAIVVDDRTGPVVTDEAPAGGEEKTDESLDLDIPLGDDVSLDDLLADESPVDAEGPGGARESEAGAGASAGESDLEEELWEVEDDEDTSASLTAGRPEAAAGSAPDEGTPIGNAELDEDQELSDEFGILDESEADITVEGLESDRAPVVEARRAAPKGKAPEPSEVGVPQQPRVAVEQSPEDKTGPMDAQGVTITTETIADIYVKQGYLDKALSVYEDLLGVYPTRDSLKQKISFVKSKMRETSGGEREGAPSIDAGEKPEVSGFPESADDARLEKNIEGLNRWLLTIRKFRRL